LIVIVPFSIYGLPAASHVVLAAMASFERDVDAEPGEATASHSAQQANAAARRQPRFWILDFGFWIADDDPRRAPNPKSKIQNLKSNVERLAPESLPSAQTTEPLTIPTSHDFADVPQPADRIEPAASHEALARG
jgi:hypothetical protein